MLETVAEIRLFTFSGMAWRAVALRLGRNRQRDECPTVVPDEHDPPDEPDGHPPGGEPAIDPPPQTNPSPERVLAGVGVRHFLMTSFWLGK